LRDYLAIPEAAGTAVIVNEVGEIGLDGAVLSESNAGLRMAMLANGCVCCMLGSDLAMTVEQLLDSSAAPLRRIVLETSGLSKPGPILRGLASLAALRLRVSVVATFDCLHWSDVSGFEEAAAQWGGAQALVLTRHDVATPAQVAAARDAAQSVNPLADIIDCDDRRAGTRAAFAPRPPAATILPDVAGPAHPRIAVMLVERLLRVKGVVAVADSEHALLVQSVGTTFSAPRRFAVPADGPFLVVIARDASANEVAGVTPIMPIGITLLGTPDPFARRAVGSLRAF
jgi:G3E family GTPase